MRIHHWPRLTVHHWAERDTSLMGPTGAALQREDERSRRAFWVSISDVLELSTKTAQKFFWRIQAHRIQREAKR